MYKKNNFQCFYFDDFNFLTTLLIKLLLAFNTNTFQNKNVLSTWSLLGKILPNLLYPRMILHNPSHVKKLISKGKRNIHNKCYSLCLYLKLK